MPRIKISAADAARKAQMAHWPATEIVMRPVGSLVPFARNARTHSDDQVAQIAASMREWGFTNPILVDEDGTVIAGHGRLLAARQLGFEEVPVMFARGWTKVQRDAYVITDNKLALNAGWNDEKLFNELLGLNSVGFDIGLTGFTAEEFDEMLTGNTTAEPGLTDPDDAPEPAEVPITEPGEIWELDGHRIGCGDSTDRVFVDRMMGQDRPQVMVTDPPYGVEYDADWRNRAVRSDGKDHGGRAVGKVENDGRADWREAWALFPGDVAYVWHAGRHASCVQQSIESCGFEIRAHIVWAKNHFAIGRGDYHWKHEPCWYAVREGGKSGWNGARDQTTVWEIDKPQKSETGHSTQKPVECMRRPIENNSRNGDWIYDPFCGSGTTIIAAEQVHRRCIAIEINPLYVDVTVRRWQEFTGKASILSGDDRSFDVVAAERQSAKRENR